MKTSLKQRAAAILKNRVLSMELEPGRLLDETELSSEFGISRTPVREIFQRLAGEGYLSVTKNRGAKVASMDLATLRHFFQAAPMIYASIARLAAEQAGPADIASLKKVQRSFRKSLENSHAAETAIHNHAFHETIGEIAKSPYLMPSLNRLLIDHTRIGQMFYQSKSMNDANRIQEAADQHDSMIEAFENHKPAAAVELTLKHWELSRGSMERFVNPDPLPLELGEIVNAV